MKSKPAGVAAVIAIVNALVLATSFGGVLAGCGSSRTLLEVDAGTDSGADASADAGTDAGAIPCGSNTCTGGEVCCNASCGICTAPSGSCPAVECEDGGFTLDGGSGDGGGCTNPVLCAPPLDGCEYVGATCDSCGTIDCQGRCGASLPVSCDRGDYCMYKQGCGRLDEQGMCTARSRGCPDIDMPVCGCDNQTYGNDCEAAAAGVNVLHSGACGTGKQCGGIRGLTCGGNEWCDVKDCRVADASGFCQPRPEACPRVLDPVCGCDGNSYDNRCEANRAGVDVLHEGRCRSR